MKNIIKIAIIISVIITMLSVTISVLANIPSDNKQYKSVLDEWVNKFNISGVGNNIKEIKDKDIIVAYLNREPIYKSELELNRYFNQANAYAYIMSDESMTNYENIKIKTDDELIKDIAIDKLIYKEAQKLGIAFTKENAIEKLKKERENTEKRASEGSKIYIDLLRKDNEYIEKLGLSWNEYIETIAADREINFETKLAFVKHYYKEEKLKKENNPNYTIKNYSDYLNELLEKSELEIINNSK